MKPVCELDQFFINKLWVEWLKPDPAIDKESVSFGFDYDLSCKKENPRLIRMVMRLILGPNEAEADGTCPYAIDTEIEGFFKFDDDIEDRKVGYLCRVNSLTILYGILRGEIANVTGSFPGGKYILPTVMMQDVVNEIEERKAKEREAQQATGGQE